MLALDAFRKPWKRFFIRNEGGPTKPSKFDSFSSLMSGPIQIGIPENEEENIIDAGVQKAEEIYTQICEWIWGKKGPPPEEGARIRARRASVVAAKSGVVIPTLDELRKRLNERCTLLGCVCSGFSVNSDPMFFNLCGTCRHPSQDHVPRAAHVDFELYINGERRNPDDLTDSEAASHLGEAVFDGIDEEGAYEDDDAVFEGQSQISEEAERVRRWGLPKKYANRFKEFMTKGHAAERTGKLEDALNFYQDAEEIAKKMGEEWLEVGVAINAQGNVLRRLGHLAVAEKQYNIALRLHAICIGENEPASASVKNNLAALYVQTERRLEALELYEEVLETLEECVGEDSPLIIVTLNNIAQLKKQQNKIEEALALYKRVLEIQSKASGEAPTAEHLRVLALAHQNMGQLSAHLQHIEQAQENYDRSAEYWRRLPGWGEVNLATVLTGSAHICTHKGLHLRAVRMFKEAREKIVISGLPMAEKAKHLKKIDREIEELEVILAMSGKSVPSSSSGPPKPKAVKSKNPFVAALLAASRSGKLEQIVDSMPAD